MKGERAEGVGVGHSFSKGTSKVKIYVNLQAIREKGQAQAFGWTALDLSLLTRFRYAEYSDSAIEL